MHLGRFLLFLLFFGALCLFSYHILLSPLNTSSSSSLPYFLQPSHYSLPPLIPPPAHIQDVSHSNFTSPFDHIYVVSLPNRADRREQMSLIASALQLNITFIDAMPSTSPLITYIAEQVHATRQRKAEYLAAVAPRSARGRTDLIGGMGVGSIWLAREGQTGLSGQPLRLPEMHDWVKDLYEAYDAGQEQWTTPTDEHFDIRKALFDPLERIASRQLNAAVLSTWWSHVEAWRVMQRNGDDKALFLEDDVDLEWDLTNMWAGVEEKLPEDWQTVFAGHCWGREMTCKSVSSGQGGTRLMDGTRAHRIASKAILQPVASMSAWLCLLSARCQHHLTLHTRSMDRVSSAHRRAHPDPPALYAALCLFHRSATHHSVERARK